MTAVTHTRPAVMSRRAQEIAEMSEPEDLIERLERETGQRIDANDGDNAAMAGLFGAISRIMGQSPKSYREEDDVAAGMLIRHQMSDEYRRKREADDMLASLLLMGFSPDDLRDIGGRR